jgi:hypothetical protein
MPSASKEDTSYTQLGIMAQIWVAFGQGAGMTRVSQKSVMALHGRYFDHIEKSGIQDVWGEHAMQVLERLRAIGRVAAHKAMERGDTTISEEDVNTAMDAVERESDTDFCPPKAG